MAYKTGRSRTLTATATYSGNIAGYSIKNQANEFQATDAAISLTLCGVSISFSQGYNTISAGTSRHQSFAYGPISWNGSASFGGSSLASGTSNIVLTSGTGTFKFPSSTTTFTLPDVRFSHDISGTATVTVPVEEWVDISVLSGGDSTNGIIDSPARYALRFYEISPAGSVVTMHATSGDLTLSGSATLSSAASASYSGTITATAFAGSQDHNRNYISPTGATQALSISATGAGGAVSGNLNVSGTDAGSSGSASTSGGVTLNVICAVPGTAGQINTAAASCTSAGNKTFALSGVIKAVDADYPSSVTLACSKYAGDPAPTFTGGSTFSSGYGQAQYSSNASVGSETATLFSNSEAVNQWQPVTVSIDGAWCRANGEYVAYQIPLDSGGSTEAFFNDDAVHLHGWTFPGLTLSQAASLVIDPCTSATGWAGGTAAGGGIQNTPGVTSLVRTFTPAKNLSGYRYLRVRVQIATKTNTDGSVDSSSRPFRVVIGGKHWTQDYQGNALTAATTAANFDIDMCDPTNDTSTSDATDTRFPVADPTLSYGGDTPAADGPLWGVSYTSGLTIDTLADGRTYTILSISQVRHTEITATFLPTHAPRFASDMILYQPITTNDSGSVTTPKVRRGLVCLTDGRQSLEAPDLEVSELEGGGSGITEYIQNIQPISNYAFDPSADAAFPAGMYPGWTGTVNAPPPDSSGNIHNGFLNSSAPASWLMGAGLLYSGSWQSGIGMNATSGVTASAQLLFSSVEWYPGIGDVFGFSGGTFGGSLQLYGHKIFRAQAHGITLKTSHGAAPGASVSLFPLSGEIQPAGTAVGTATTDSPEAVYRTSGAALTGYTTTGTGTSASTSPSGGMVTASGAGTGTGNTTFRTRHLSRMAFRVRQMLKTGALANLGQRDGPYHRAAVQKDTDGTPLGIFHWRADIGSSYAWDETTQPVTTRTSASSPSLAMDHRNRLIVGYVDDGSGSYAPGGYETSTHHDGGVETDWSEPAMSIPGAKYYKVRGGKDGSLMRLAWVDDGTDSSTGILKTTYQAPGESAASSPVTLKDETGATISASDLAPDLDHVAAGSSPWRISVMEAGQSTPSEFVCYSETDPSWKRAS